MVEALEREVWGEASNPFWESVREVGFSYDLVLFQRYPQYS